MCRILNFECLFENGNKAVLFIPDYDDLNRNLCSFLEEKKETGVKNFHFKQMSLLEGSIDDFDVKSRHYCYPETRSSKMFQAIVSLVVPDQNVKNTVVFKKYDVPEARIVQIKQVTSEVEREKCFSDADLQIPYSAIPGIRCILVDNEDD